MDKLKKSSSKLFKVTGNRQLQSKALKVKFSKLTDSDLKFETGKENELLTRVESRLDKKRLEVIDILKRNMTLLPKIK